MDIYQQALKAHKRLKGKLSVETKDPLDTREALSTFYTPGVGGVSTYVAEHPDEARLYTGLNNSVAIISDGSAVLGLGNIGPLGALPVMEGKAMLFKKFAGIDGFPIVLSTQQPEEIIAAVRAIAPSFGGINLEDIAAPNCFMIEETLKRELQTPLMHDDQHATAIVSLAGIINAMKIVGKNLAHTKVAIIGAGAAGNAIAHLLHAYAQPDIVVVDSKGIVVNTRVDLDSHKMALAAYNKENATGDLSDALRDTDIVLGVSKAGLITPAMVKTMASKPVIFAMANPEPEILPDAAKKAGVAVMATGRSDFPNQVNNALVFPGVFRGALDNNVRQITTDHKLAAAEVLARLVKKPSADEIVPSILNKRIVPAIAKVIR